MLIILVIVTDFTSMCTFGCWPSLESLCRRETRRKSLLSRWHCLECTDRKTYFLSCVCHFAMRHDIMRLACNIVKLKFMSFAPADSIILHGKIWTATRCLIYYINIMLTQGQFLQMGNSFWHLLAQENNGFSYAT